MILPANIGLFEAAHAIVTEQLMMGAPVGILVAIMVRIRAIAWSLIGYFVFRVFIASTQKHKASKSK